MKKLFPILLACLYFSCGTNAPSPVPPTDVYITVHDTLTIVKDSIVTVTPVVYTLLADTFHSIIKLYPSGGDDQPQIQTAINYCFQHPPYHLKLAAAATYRIDRPLQFFQIGATDYNQVSFYFEGVGDAKNAPVAYVSHLVSNFTWGPAILVQKGKTCYIKNMLITGPYSLPNYLSPSQICTYTWRQWSDGVCADGRTNICAAISIDNFSRPDYIDNGPLYKRYDSLPQCYLPEMSQGGSTDIHIEGVAIQNFVAGIVITPSFQLNGELIYIEDCHIDYCRAGICWTQAQSKANYVKNLMCWGNTRNIFDGNNFGRWRGDGSTAPYIDGVNVAGINHQLIQATSYAFPASFSRIYAEGLYKIGSCGGQAETHFFDCQFDMLGLQPGLPSPDFWYQGAATFWSNCMIRLYGDGVHRIVLNSNMNTFVGGTMSNPPICLNGQYMTPNTTFQDVIMFYGSGLLSSNNYDTVMTPGSSFMRTNSSYEGYVISQYASSMFNVGDMVMTWGSFTMDTVPNIATAISTYQYPMGYVSGISGDTVLLTNMGPGLPDSTFMPTFVYRLKPGFKF